MISKTAVFLAIPFLGFAQEPMPLCATYTPGQLCLCDGWGISAKGEALYWVAREHHLISEISNAGFKKTDQIPPGLDRWDFHGKVMRIEPSWNFGWRVSAGFTSQCDYWDLFSSWTSFHCDARDKTDIIDLPGIPLWGHSDAASASHLYASHAKWNLHYNIFNAEFGRAFWIGKCLIFRPHFGLQTTWIKQHFDLLFDFKPQDHIPFGAIIHLNCDVTAPGLRSGFDLHFTHGTGFGLYGKIAMSLLYGKFSSHFTEDETFAKRELGPITEQTSIADSQDHFHMGISAFQGIIGIDWNTGFCCDRYRFGLQIQWEFNLWNDLNKFNHYFNCLENSFPPRKYQSHAHGTFIWRRF